ncbi:MAG: hypothetical protein P4L85_25825 [Paludisphaera borealis]|uniref:hypothetical protein n=1 Tax=Paludisphaera borealis TaxID=1387353 RepID=UPI002850AC97|nr:hypothetical protein [Paludisphaera borealis]MDR3622799.1 hypothetical protein [Paludisphaera borealis]
MAKYYVSANRGSDSTGVGTAANPWKTIGKAIGPTPAITLSGTGDVLYIEPGVYREVVTLGLAPTAAGPLSIVGDGDGAGYLAGGYATPATGTVDWRGWTNDTTPITTTACLVISGKSFVTLQGVKMIGSHGGGGSCVDLNGTWSDVSFLDCIFLGSIVKPYIIYAVRTPGAAMNLTVKRCDFLTGQGYCIDVRVGLYSVEYNVNVLVQNCRFLGGTGGVRVANASGTGSFFATGVTIQNCTFMFTTAAFSVTAPAGVNLAAACVISGCYINQAVTGLSGGNTTHIAEDYNIIYATTPRTLVNVGPNSITNAAPAFDFNDGRLSGVPLRPFGEPSAVGAIGGFGSSGTAPAIDLWNRARPEGFGAIKAAAGALERHDTGAKDVTHQDAGSPACLALVGPSSQERPILVNPQATTLSIKVRWDGNHGDAAKPQAILLSNPEIGVAAQTITAASTGGVGATPNGYETLTFAPITPTAAGVVMLRMASRAAAGNGAAYFDTITLS